MLCLATKTWFFTISCYKVGRHPVDPHRIFKGIAVSESNWNFSLCIWKGDEGIKPRLKKEGIESAIFFLKLVWLKFSKRYTAGVPGAIYFALHNYFKTYLFVCLFSQTQHMNSQAN